MARPSPDERPGPAELGALRGLVAAVAQGRPANCDFALLPGRFVRRHHLAPLAYKAGVAAFRPDAIASSLLVELRAELLREAADALGAAGVRVALLKGIAYAGTLYPDPGDRPMTDIDLLVPPEDHPRAAHILTELGYEDRSKPVARSPLHHASSFFRERAAIDLHRTIVPALRSRIDLRAVWERSRPAPELGSTVRRLEPVDLALFHLIHIARHELLVPAIAYVDAARLLRTIDRSVLLARAGRWRLWRGVTAAIAMTDVLAGGANQRDVPWPLGLGRILPSPNEILALRQPARPIQVLRKALLLEGPAELAGLVRVYLHEQWAARR